MYLFEIVWPLMRLQVMKKACIAGQVVVAAGQCQVENRPDNEIDVYFRPSCKRTGFQYRCFREVKGVDTVPHFRQVYGVSAGPATQIDGTAGFEMALFDIPD